MYSVLVLIINEYSCLHIRFSFTVHVHVHVPSLRVLGLSPWQSASGFPEPCLPPLDTSLPPSSFPSAHILERRPPGSSCQSPPPAPPSLSLSLHRPFVRPQVAPASGRSGQ